MIRPALAADLRCIQEIEIAAGELFRGLGMDAVADDPPPSIEQLKVFLLSGTAWVAAGTSGGPIAYILVTVCDSWAHIEQVTVHPRHGRRGVGGALIDHVEGWAREQGLCGLSLTTFRDVPWNGPYYERLGFSNLPESGWPAHLRGVVRGEANLGLDAWPRMVMARRITPAPFA